MTTSISAGASERLRLSVPGTTGRPFEVSSFRPHASSQESSASACAGVLARSWTSADTSTLCPLWRRAPDPSGAHLRNQNNDTGNRSVGLGALTPLFGVDDGFDDGLYFVPANLFAISVEECF